MKVWISKYALTQGIFAVEGERCTSSGSPDMIQARGKGLPAFYHGEGRDWHLSFDAASSRAEKMREDKLASMRKKMGKLQSLKFSDPLRQGQSK